MEKNNPNKILSPFLRKLADDLDEEKLSAEQRQRIGEFYMSWLFKDSERSHETESEPDSEIDSEPDYDALKFLTMGWYVYTQILEGNTI